MSAIEAPFITAAGETKGTVELPASLFSGQESRHVLYDVLVALRANQRRGTSDTKTRAEVSGGGRKPWKQKHTGNARSGSNRSPLWRKGGIIFGPHPRSYRIDIPAEKRKAALLTGLAEKGRSASVRVLETIPDTGGKTGPAVKFLAKAAPEGSILLIVDKMSEPLSRAVRNIARLEVSGAQEVNAWTVLSANNVLFTQAGLRAMSERFEKRKNGESASNH